jgi:hypothetical protein
MLTCAVTRHAGHNVRGHVAHPFQNDIRRRLQGLVCVWLTLGEDRVEHIANEVVNGLTFRLSHGDENGLFLGFKR